MTAFKLFKKNILIISPEPWYYINVSKHHYARELLKRGHRIFFLNPPDPDNYRNLTLTQTDEMPGLILADYPGHIKGYRFLSSSIRIWLNKRFLKKLEQRSKCRVDVIWNFENSRFYDMKFAGSRLKIYHQVDLNQDFHVKEVVSQSDICFCTSDVIKRIIEPMNSKAYKIHHGTSEHAMFFNYEQNTLKTNDIVTAVYIGNLDMPYIDRELFQQLLQTSADVRFILVGPYDINGTFYQRFKDFNIITWVGKKPVEEIPNYLQLADVLLVLYAEDHHKDQSSPHKFMEYFASGKTIVATYTEEYKDKKDLLVMSKNNNEYTTLFRKVIDNITVYNAPFFVQKRRSFAADNTYQKQVDRINEKLQTNGISYMF